MTETELNQQNIHDLQQLCQQLLFQLNDSDNEKLKTKIEMQSALKELNEENEQLKTQILVLNQKRFDLEHSLHVNESEKIEIQKQFEKEVEVLNEKVKKVKEKKKAINKTVNDLQNKINFNKIQSISLNETLKSQISKSVKFEKQINELMNQITYIKNSFKYINEIINDKELFENNQNDFQLINDNELKGLILQTFHMVQKQVNDLKMSESKTILFQQENEQLKNLIEQKNTKLEELKKCKKEFIEENTYLKGENKELNGIIKEQQKQIESLKKENICIKYENEIKEEKEQINKYDEMSFNINLTRIEKKFNCKVGYLNGGIIFDNYHIFKFKSIQKDEHICIINEGFPVKIHLCENKEQIIIPFEDNDKQLKLKGGNEVIIGFNDEIINIGKECSLTFIDYSPFCRIHMFDGIIDSKNSIFQHECFVTVFDKKKSVEPLMIGGHVIQPGKDLLEIININSISKPLIVLTVESIETPTKSMDAYSMQTVFKPKIKEGEYFYIDSTLTYTSEGIPYMFPIPYKDESSYLIYFIRPGYSNDYITIQVIEQID
ncbi:hypothetical protein EHI8A_052680 [Entamoeba histolytica HM-1:IMSS-B]|uniref:Uncharacterized protein n=6 Tax=Entamoeba histolytica TaxID=5759 RepID=C4LWD2_ENTH1|nr:hypothetical protein EHI_096190 [Entamoeba histolytica HM-1:IMSS]EMD44591.1 Hypothetical protein EHI5A_008770 [Entamoeba histolytica KU27]EMH74189.1 hypothetical protein EHI8A_052680 [Entamoeba histolytica HM-1:IMSS-B]EMS12664.1 hypothetical protein KM1_006120 [Entamoeba histolytica HM-3:IMSS]ENY64369.1 hypothetical protein EHI7A_001690 [Entamoeba histolytica HM-1:IMSS-A]GAT93016.1 hypothetical protein CL6EHI_096190 [Entamoeba histolytica]|eukprot:XP_656894.1 hypothetical protein EHI_096190 [Entamoeba histolytica HM-1:IMSS]